MVGGWLMDGWWMVGGWLMDGWWMVAWLMNDVISIAFC